MGNQQMCNLDPERELNPPEYEEKMEDDPDFAHDNFIEIEQTQINYQPIRRSREEQQKIMSDFYKTYEKNAIKKW